MGNRAIITDKEMQARASGADQWLHEPFERGAGVFAARLTPGGERLFYFRYTDTAGKRPYLKLGAYRQSGGVGLIVSEARALARSRSDLYLTGVRDLHAHFEATEQANNSAAELECKRAALELAALEAKAHEDELDRQRRVSLRVLFERWVKTDLQPRTRTDGKRTGRKDGGAFTRGMFERRVFANLGAIAIEDVKKADLLTILDAAKAEGKLRTANVLLGDLKQMFRFALARDLVQRNPLETVTKRDVGGPSVERDRVLSHDEIRALARALPSANLHVRTTAALWLLLSTMCRVGELMGAVWNDPGLSLRQLRSIAETHAVKLGVVDPKARTWHLIETKNQRAHTIHLSNFALHQFDLLCSVREAGRQPGDPPLPWVFPDSSGTGPVSVKSFGKQMADRQRTPDRRLANRTKATESLMLQGGRWTGHDLRRTGATLMAELGISGDVIDECLNHIIESRVRRIYIRDRREADQVRAFDALGARLAVLTAEPRVQDRPNARERAESRLAAFA
jgi:integrase